MSVGKAAVVAASMLLLAPASGPARTDLVPEYAVLVSAIGGGLVAAGPIYTCKGPDLLAITEALEGPAGVQRIGVEATAQALGSTKKPWPRNHRAFGYAGQRYVPDFVKGRSFYLVETSHRLDLTPELTGLQAVARRRGGDLTVVTRRVTTLAPTVAVRAKQAWRAKAGRLRIVRCI